MNENLYGGLFLALGFGGIALLTVGAGLERKRILVAGFALWLVAIAAALDSIRRDGLSGF
jgi:hypothetical protein